LVVSTSVKSSILKLGVDPVIVNVLPDIPVLTLPAPATVIASVVLSAVTLPESLLIVANKF